MDIKLSSGTYKSFTSPFEWSSVPNFVMLCGPNGSGKSQLLELIEGIGRNGKMGDARGTLIGLDIGTDDIVLLNNWTTLKSNAINLTDVQNAKTGLINQLKQTKSRTNTSNKQIQFFVSKAKERFDKFPDELSEEELTQLLLLDFAATRQNDVNQLLHDLGSLSVAYRLEFSDYAIKKFEQVGNAQDIEHDIGAPPCQIMNELLEAAGFQHKVIEPQSLTSSYEVRIRNNNGANVSVSDLSSGEMSLLMLTLLIFGTQRTGAIPKILLLDEPDAHLHPEMIRSFYKALKEVLVDKYGVVVICTTHRLEAIALTPPESLFEVVATGEQRVHPVESVNSALAKLSADILSILPKVRCVLVEDNDDVEFYNTVRSVYARVSPETIDMLPFFQAASVGRGAHAIPGGRTVVESWVDKLAESGLDTLVKGVIDLDGGNQPKNGIHVIGRYSIENYICDPLVVYTQSVDAGQPIAVDSLPTITRGQEHLIRDWDAETIQKLIDAVTNIVIEKNDVLHGQPLELVDVQLTNGKTIKYPKWQIENQGHALLGYYRTAFGSIVDPKALLRSLDRLALIPTELANLITTLSE